MRSGISDLPAAGYADAKDHNAGKQWCRLDLGSGWAALHKEIPEVWDHSAGRSCHGCSGWQCIPEASDCPSAPLLAGSKRTASDCCPERLLVPSGHTLASVIGATILTAADRRFGIIAIPLAILIAFSRLYLYVHFPSDMTGGCEFWGLGTGY